MRFMKNMPECCMDMFYGFAKILSFKEIGQIFGKSETWGRVTFYRAKESLKYRIGDE